MHDKGIKPFHPFLSLNINGALSKGQKLGISPNYREHDSHLLL